LARKTERGKKKRKEPKEKSTKKGNILRVLGLKKGVPLALWLIAQRRREFTDTVDLGKKSHQRRRGASGAYFVVE